MIKKLFTLRNRYLIIFNSVKIFIKNRKDAANKNMIYNDNLKKENIYNEEKNKQNHEVNHDIIYQNNGRKESVHEKKISKKEKMKSCQNDNSFSYNMKKCKKSKSKKGKNEIFFDKSKNMKNNIYPLNDEANKNFMNIQNKISNEINEDCNLNKNKAFNTKEDFNYYIEKNNTIQVNFINIKTKKNDNLSNLEINTNLIKDREKNINNKNTENNNQETSKILKCKSEKSLLHKILKELNQKNEEESYKHYRKIYFRTIILIIKNVISLIINILSIINYIIQTIFQKKTNESSDLVMKISIHLDIFFSLYFLLELILYFYWDRKNLLKRIFYFEVLISILTIIPPLIVVFSKNTFLSLNFLCIFRFFKIIKLYKLVKMIQLEKSIFSSKNDVDKEYKVNPVKMEFYSLILYMFLNIFIWASIVISLNRVMNYAFNLTDMNFFDAFYYIVITTSSVGYGDISPTNIVTRMLIIFSLFIGLYIISNQLSKISTLYNTWGSLTTRYKFKNHIILVLDKTINYISVIESLQKKVGKTQIVIISTDDLFLNSNLINNKKIKLIKETEPSLECFYLANLEKAAALLIFTEKSPNSFFEKDKKIDGLIFRISIISRNVPIYIQNLFSDKSSFKSNNKKDPKKKSIFMVKKIIPIMKIKSLIQSKCLFNPGFACFIQNLLFNDKGIPLDVYKYSNVMKNYFYGTENEIIIKEFPSIFWNMEFCHAAYFIYNISVKDLFDNSDVNSNSKNDNFNKNTFNLKKNINFEKNLNRAILLIGISEKIKEENINEVNNLDYIDDSNLIEDNITQIFPKKHRIKSNSSGIFISYNKENYVDKFFEKNFKENNEQDNSDKNDFKSYINKLLKVYKLNRGNSNFDSDLLRNNYLNDNFCSYKNIINNEKQNELIQVINKSFQDKYQKDNPQNNKNELFSKRKNKTSNPFKRSYYKEIKISNKENKKISEENNKLNLKSYNNFSIKNSNTKLGNFLSYEISDTKNDDVNRGNKKYFHKNYKSLNEQKEEKDIFNTNKNFYMNNIKLHRSFKNKKLKILSNNGSDSSCMRYFSDIKKRKNCIISANKEDILQRKKNYKENYKKMSNKIYDFIKRSKSSIFKINEKSKIENILTNVYKEENMIKNNFKDDDEENSQISYFNYLESFKDIIFHQDDITKLSLENSKIRKIKSFSNHFHSKNKDFILNSFRYNENEWMRKPREKETTLKFDKSKIITTINPSFPSSVIQNNFNTLNDKYENDKDFAFDYSNNIKNSKIIVQNNPKRKFPIKIKFKEDIHKNDLVKTKSEFIKRSKKLSFLDSNKIKKVKEKLKQLKIKKLLNQVKRKTKNHYSELNRLVFEFHEIEYNYENRIFLMEKNLTLKQKNFFKDHIIIIGYQDKLDKFVKLITYHFPNKPICFIGNQDEEKYIICEKVLKENKNVFYFHGDSSNPLHLLNANLNKAFYVIILTQNIFAKLNEDMNTLLSSKLIDSYFDINLLIEMWDSKNVNLLSYLPLDEKTENIENEFFHPMFMSGKLVYLNHFDKLLNIGYENPILIDSLNQMISLGFRKFVNLVAGRKKNNLNKRFKVDIPIVITIDLPKEYRQRFYFELVNDLLMMDKFALPLGIYILSPLKYQKSLKENNLISINCRKNKSFNSINSKDKRNYNKDACFILNTKDNLKKGVGKIEIDKYKKLEKDITLINDEFNSINNIIDEQRIEKNQKAILKDYEQNYFEYMKNSKNISYTKKIIMDFIDLNNSHLPVFITNPSPDFILPKDCKILLLTNYSPLVNTYPEKHINEFSYKDQNYDKYLFKKNNKNLLEKSFNEYEFNQNIEEVKDNFTRLLKLLENRFDEKYNVALNKNY